MKLISLLLVSLLGSSLSFAMDGSSHRQTALNYGMEFVNLGSFEDALLEHLKSQPESERTVVEFGGGFGRIALKVVSEVEGVNYFCTDLSQTQIAEVHQKSQNATYAKDSTLKAFVCNCTEDVDIESNIADVVVIANVFHFLHPKQALKALENAHRILKPNGKLFIMTQTPHFAMQDILQLVTEKKASIKDRRDDRNAQLKILTEKCAHTDLSTLLDLQQEAVELDKILDEILEDEETLKPFEKALYSPTCFCEIFKIYSENNLAFPGYTNKRSMLGLSVATGGKTVVHNAMNQPYLLILTGDLLLDMARPFGFEVVSQKEYKLTKTGAVEKDVGTSLGIIFKKTGEGSPDLILELQKKADEADNVRASFHRNHVVTYNEDFPYLKVSNLCCSPNCKEVGNNRCGACGKAIYCSEKCQRAHWPVHKVHCPHLK